MKCNTLYTPGGTNGKSFCTDLILELKKSTLAVNWKVVMEPIGISEIADELFKALCSKRDGKNMTFLVVATRIKEEQIAEISKKIFDPNGSKNVLAYRICSGVKLLFTTEFFNNQRNNFIKYGIVGINQNDFQENPNSRKQELMAAVQKAMTRQNY